MGILLGQDVERRIRSAWAGCADELEVKQDVVAFRESENVLTLDEEKNVESVKHLPLRRNMIGHLQIGI
jgi:hypothetical protein